MVLVQPDRLTHRRRVDRSRMFSIAPCAVCASPSRTGVTCVVSIVCPRRTLWLPREDLLTCEEICTLVSVFTDLGVDKVRLTGGEPLLRRDADPGADAGAQSPDHGPGLDDERRAVGGTGTGSLRGWAPSRHREPGYACRTVSRRSRTVTFQSWRGSRRSSRVGFTGVKLDTVVMRGYNDDELVDLIEYGKRLGAEVRFIEYMDVGRHALVAGQGVFSAAMLAVLRQQYGDIEPLAEERAAPAERFVLPDGTILGLLPQRPHRSVTPVTAADSRPMACGSCVSTPRARICASPCGLARRQKRSSPALSRAGRRAGTVALKSATRSRPTVGVGPGCSSTASARTHTLRCIPGAGRDVGAHDNGGTPQPGQDARACGPLHRQQGAEDGTGNN